VVWLAIPNKARAPKMDYPPLRIVRFSGAALTAGIEERQIDGVTVRVTNVARTVADCFKFRNKTGLDVVMEALQEAWRDKRVSMDELWRYATLSLPGQTGSTSCGSGSGHDRSRETLILRRYRPATVNASLTARG
jgi:predicted transcriptional regulator of viral defense system